MIELASLCVLFTVTSLIQIARILPLTPEIFLSQRERSIDNHRVNITHVWTCMISQLPGVIQPGLSLIIDNILDYHHIWARKAGFRK